MYLHHILQNKRESLLRRFFEAQLLNPTHRDWATQVLEDLEELGIDLELEQIEEMKRDFFKTIVKDAVQRKAFKSLINRKNSRTEETQFHLLSCKYLLGKNENISYIPETIQNYLKGTYRNKYIFQEF